MTDITQPYPLQSALDALPRRLRDLMAPPTVFRLSPPHATDRCALESYIAERFAQDYGAQLYEFLPWLVAMECCGRISAAAGVKGASQGELFVEQYLDEPVEEQLSLHLRKAGTDGIVHRHRVAEIGNLVASHRGASQLFFLLLADSLRQAGIDWIVFSATRQVASILDKLHCDTVNLGLADSSRLGSRAVNWGSYYDHQPRVLAVNLPAAISKARHSLTQSIALDLYAQHAALIASQFTFPSSQQGSALCAM